MTVFEQPMPEAAAVRAAPKLAQPSKGGGGVQPQVASPPEAPAANPTERPSAFARHFSREGQDRQQGTLRCAAALCSPPTLPLYSNEYSYERLGTTDLL